MFSFANPEYLYLLILIPVIFGLFLLSRMIRAKNIRKYGNPALLEAQMPDVSKYKLWIKISIQLVALALIVIILARPRAMGNSKAETINVQGIEVMVALDVSNSMLASSTDDPNGISRLQQAKLLLEKLIDKLGNDKVGLIVFAGDAYTQIPITADFVSAKMFLSNIEPSMVPTQGTAIGAAIKMAANSFTADDKIQKSIILITDGENHEDDAVEAAKDAHDKGIQINVLGVGTPKGAPIPIGGKGNYMKDESGNIVITQPNEQIAQDVANAGKGIYVSGTNRDALNVLDARLKELSKSNISKNVFSPNDEQFPVFAWVALALLICDIFVLDRKISWLKNINFFSK
jgi:Ca-activated chloride channel family protein